MNLLSVLADSTMSRDEAEGRRYGWLHGVVTDAERVDGKKTCRVKARVGKQGDQESSDWLVPLLPGAIESVPNVNDRVAVFFMDGDPNRGAYLYFPDSRTQGRPVDAIPLGDVMAGIINGLVDQVKTMKTKLNQAIVDISTITTLVNVTGLAVAGALAKASPTIAQTSGTDADPDPAKCQKADGSTVSTVSADSKALSGRARVGI